MFYIPPIHSGFYFYTTLLCIMCISMYHFYLYEFFSLSMYIHIYMCVCVYCMCFPILQNGFSILSSFYRFLFPFIHNSSGYIRSLSITKLINKDIFAWTLQLLLLVQQFTVTVTYQTVNVFHLTILGHFEQ